MAHRNCNPKPGDLIQVKRPLYQHWALYLGDGYVINVTPVDEGAPSLSASTESVFTRKAKVKKQLLKDVVGNDKWKVNNKYDRSRTPLPVAEIIRRAEHYIDREVTYSLFRKNCEHFVTMLRYDEKVSDQARIAAGAAAAVEIGIACVSGAAALVIGIPVLVGYLGFRIGHKIASLLD